MRMRPAWNARGTALLSVGGPRSLTGSSVLPNASKSKSAPHARSRFCYPRYIKKLHNVSYSGQREGVTLLAIEQLEMSRAARKANPADALQHDWSQVAVALRMATSFPTPEHAYTFYQQLDQLMLFKEAMAAEARSPGVALPQSQQADAHAHPAIARIAGGGGGEADDSFMSAVSDIDLETQRVRQWLRHRSGPFCARFPAPPRPTCAACYTLLGAMLIGC